MKTIKNLFSLSIFISMILLVLGSCGTPNQVLNKTADINVSYLSLADYLRSKGGITVTGAGDDIRLQLRGINSFGGDTRPFIYIDGSPVGRSYRSANSAVNPNMIASVRILSSLSELARYGEDGNSGIVLIKTKKQ